MIPRLPQTPPRHHAIARPRMQLAPPAAPVAAATARCRTAAGTTLIWNTPHPPTHPPAHPPTPTREPTRLSCARGSGYGSVSHCYGDDAYGEVGPTRLMKSPAGSAQVLLITFSFHMFLHFLFFFRQDRPHAADEVTRRGFFLHFTCCF